MFSGFNEKKKKVGKIDKFWKEELLKKLNGISIDQF